MKVEIIYDADCPNVEKVREVLKEAFVRVGIPPSWSEWVRNEPGAPLYARQFGSPTILVNGRDVVGTNPSQEQHWCRLYVQPGGGFEGAPSVWDVLEALQRASASDPVMNQQPGAS